MEVLSLAMPDRFPRPLRSCSRLQDLVQPCLQAGLQRALPMRRSGEELSVTILVSPDDPSSRPSWNVSVHLSNYVTRSPPTPAQVAMLGSGRALPSPILRVGKRPGISGGGEACWCNRDFVVQRWGWTSGRFGYELLCRRAMNPGVEVQAAALGDGVLPGVIRQLVIEVCEDDEIPVREVMPSWRSRETWIEAFVTSDLRIVQPVESIRRCHRWVPGNRLELLSNCEWTEVRFQRITSVTGHIRSPVLRRAFDEGVRVFEFLDS